MASEKQKAASRANGAKSRGPVTSYGKLRSSLSNAERGMLARTVVLDGESRPRFDAFLISLQEELKTETTIENLLIHKMAAAHWRQMRVWGIERSGLSNEINDAGPPDVLAFGKSRNHLNEYEMRFDRQFTRALEPLREISRHTNPASATN